MLFTNKSFHVFQASSLEERMQEIRKRDPTDFSANW